MNHEEIIQKTLQDTLKNENSKIEELDKEIFALQDELRFCEKDLLDLGFDFINPDAVPQFKDDSVQKEYMQLLDTRADLIKRLNTAKGDKHVYQNSQEN